jgi:hypothetical protein
MAASAGRASLCDLPLDDPRPAPWCDAVLESASAVAADKLLVWLQAQIKANRSARTAAGIFGKSAGVLNHDAQTIETVRYAVKIALGQEQGDPWMTARQLEDTFSWPMNMEGARLIEQITANLHVAHRVVTGKWVLRTGLKFPGACNDQIEWSDETGTDRAGDVISLDRLDLAAIVRPKSTGYFGSATPLRVRAEQVYANVSQGLYALATPTGSIVLPEPDLGELPSQLTRLTPSLALAGDGAQKPFVTAHQHPSLPHGDGL